MNEKESVLNGRRLEKRGEKIYSRSEKAGGAKESKTRGAFSYSEQKTLTWEAGGYVFGD